MMCRQVLPDTKNGIEQIYIVKTEPGTDGEDNPAPMVPEDVDYIKQELSTDEPDTIQKEEAIIKDELEDGFDDVFSHGDSQLFACHCGLSYRKETLLSEHQQTCDIPENTTETLCRFCKQAFSSYSEMIKHIKGYHGSIMPETKCAFCTDRFKSAILLSIHEFRHNLPNVIKCDQCNRIFKQESNLQRHMKLHSHENESFACDECGKVFYQSLNLEIHKRIHSGTTPHSCDLCPRSFYCQSTLRHHRTTHLKSSAKYAGKTDLRIEIL